ncbi:MAG TPA: hypothetical protein VE907_11735 [Gammaproteobacteria bacterium]|nr:hypothetical protein [Gammaproteobacteria bacterium]
MRLGRALAGAIALAACATTPTERVERLASEHGFVREVVHGTRFDHVVYRNARPAAGALHVYIEGDGSPYLDPDVVARDPTPRVPVMLELMALDRAASIYVGRPCYFGLYATAGCSLMFWTIGRFNLDVVESMAAVVERAAAASGADGLVLIGHSGGGALAVLLAPRLHGVRAVVTVAGTLDTDAWTELHGYAPLALSLNPSAEPLVGVPLVLHLAGADDDVVPPSLVSAAARKLGAGEVRVVPGTRHTCCWGAAWPSVLDGLP